MTREYPECAMEAGGPVSDGGKGVRLLIWMGASWTNFSAGPVVRGFSQLPPSQNYLRKSKTGIIAIPASPPPLTLRV